LHQQGGFVYLNVGHLILRADLEDVHVVDLKCF
jgi:hypothetical protein